MLYACTYEPVKLARANARYRHLPAITAQRIAESNQVARKDLELRGAEGVRLGIRVARKVVE